MLREFPSELAFSRIIGALVVIYRVEIILREIVQQVQKAWNQI